LEALKTILNNCQQLESIRIFYCSHHLNSKKLLDIFTRYSPKNFCELKIYYKYDTKLKLLPESLESFFSSWADRVPQKPLSFAGRIFSNNLKVKKQYMGIIEKYKKLGVIRSIADS